LLTVAAASNFGTYLGLSALFPVLLGATSALHTGVLLLPAAGVAAVTAYVIGAKEIPASRTLLALGISSGGGVLLAAISNASPILIALAACLIVSPWAGALVVGLEAVPRLVPTDDQGVALGLFNFLFVIGGSLGAATAGAFLSATGAVTATLLMGTLPIVAIASAAALSHRATAHVPTGGRKRER
jgi:DHA2 family metal-tetracycline-proton antiporter-like MFS transporter